MLARIQWSNEQGETELELVDWSHKSPGDRRGGLHSLVSWVQSWLLSLLVISQIWVSELQNLHRFSSQVWEAWSKKCCFGLRDGNHWWRVQEISPVSLNQLEIKVKTCQRKVFFPDRSSAPTNLTSFSQSVFFPPIPGELKRYIMFMKSESHHIIKLFQLGYTSSPK